MANSLLPSAPPVGAALSVLSRNFLSYVHRAIPLASNASHVSKVGQQVSTFFCKYVLSGISFISSYFLGHCLGDMIAHQVSVLAPVLLSAVNLLGVP